MKKVTIENAKKVGQGLGIPKKHLGEFETIIQEALQKPNESVTWDNLRELLLDREKRGTMTRYALAKKAGLPESTIHRVLDGTQEPKINTLIKISKAVGINIQAS